MRYHTVCRKQYIPVQLIIDREDRGEIGYEKTERESFENVSHLLPGHFAFFSRCRLPALDADGLQGPQLDLVLVDGGLCRDDMGRDESCD